MLDTVKRMMPHGMVQRAGNFRRRIHSVREAVVSGEQRYCMDIRAVSGFQVAYRRDTADEDVIEDSFDNDPFFPELPHYTPSPNDVMIDIGAHIGTFSLMAARKVPQGRVFAIEASQDTYNFLCINTALNGEGNVIKPCHLAISDQRGLVRLHHDEGNWGHSIMKVLSASGEEVETDTLHGFCSGQDISHVDLIKFNCEGAEFPILLNSSQEFLRRIERMLVLYHLDLVENHNRSDLLNHLRGAGFHCDIRHEEGPRGWIIAQR